MILYGLLLFIPVSAALHFFFAASGLWVFLTSAVAIAVLAEWLRRATEQVAARIGPAAGGLLMVSFGSMAELILALFVLMGGDTATVQAQITGSIIGTSLFGLGLAILIGGVTRERQSFNPARAGLLATLLILVVVALLLPAVFDLAGRHGAGQRDLRITDEELSVCASFVLLFLYLGNLAYTLVTHRNVFGSDEPGGDAKWSLWVSLAVMVGATVAVALEAEMLSGALSETAATLHLPTVFLGVILLGLIGTSADVFAAAWFARQDRIGLAFNICIGSAIQVALVIAPLLVIISWLIGTPMNLVFSNPLHLFAVAATAFVVNAVARDGETTWFEGLVLVGVYVLFGLAFFFSAPA